MPLTPVPLKTHQKHRISPTSPTLVVQLSTKWLEVNLSLMQSRTQLKQRFQLFIIRFSIRPIAFDFSRRLLEFFISFQCYRSLRICNTADCKLAAILNNVHLKTDTENNLLCLGGYNPLELGKFSCKQSTKTFESLIKSDLSGTTKC